MKRPIKVAVLAVLVVLAGLGLVACGSSDDDGSGSGETMQVSYSSFPVLDPGLSYTQEGWTALFEVYVPLLTYAREDGAGGSKVVPGLAEALPKVSADGKTYTLTLRSGLEYADGKPVKASDFKATIERLFEINSPGSTYYEAIVGAEEFAKTRKGGISGIKADDKTGEITIELTSPRGTFSNELALPFAAPIPAGTADKDQTASPPPSTGPYEVTAVKQGKSFTIRRNPAWTKSNEAAMPDLPGGSIEQFDVTIVRNANTQVNDVESGATQWMQNPPPADRYAAVKREFDGTQFRADPTLSTYFFWLNTSEPPFDDPKVREAVSYAVDPKALERIYAGSLVGENQMLPPGMPGYEKFDLFPADLDKAKEVLAEANPSDLEIGVWTDDESPNKEAGEYFDSVLQELGFETKLKIPSADIYFEQITTASTPELNAGWANWFSDYPHPNAFFQPLFTEEGIAEVGATNLSRWADPAFSKEVGELAEGPLGPEEETAYARLDKEGGEAVAYVPYGTGTIATFVSDEIDFDALVVNPTFGQNLTSFEFK